MKLQDLKKELSETLSELEELQERVDCITAHVQYLKQEIRKLNWKKEKVEACKIEVGDVLSFYSISARRGGSEVLVKVQTINFEDGTYIFNKESEMVRTSGPVVMNTDLRFKNCASEEILAISKNIKSAKIKSSSVEVRFYEEPEKEEVFSLRRYIFQHETKNTLTATLYGCDPNFNCSVDVNTFTFSYVE